MTMIYVNDKMQQGYSYVLSAQMGMNFAPDFMPELTPQKILELGVFEGLFLYIIPGDTDPALLFGALIAYRIIYYLLPLVFSSILLFSYEGYLGYRRKRILRRELNKES